VGNRQATNSCRGGIHTAAHPSKANATAAVGTETPCGLREATFSPASTVPMTTTELYMNQLPSTKQAPRGPKRTKRLAGPRPQARLANRKAVLP
jgi:hypothetical protein